MEPITNIINRIKWDKREDPSDYVIGYEDRVSKKVIEVKFTEIKRIEDNFMVLERNMEEVSIPLHRIRVVKKKGNAVWERKIKSPKAREEP